MRVSIFGLGYVGCVGAGCLCSLGHRVIGVDVSEHKVSLINEGRPTIIEKDIESLIRKARDEGRISATTDVREAVSNTDISFIAVGTPSTREGHLNLDYIFRVAGQIGEALKDKDTSEGAAKERKVKPDGTDCTEGAAGAGVYIAEKAAGTGVYIAEKAAGAGAPHIIAIRSTVLPGTNEKVAEIIEKASGKRADEDFCVVSNPEFLREGTAVEDYLNPPLTLVGTGSMRAGEIMRALYDGIPGEFILTDIRVAEMMKYVNNTFHALKIVFGNEVGNICKALDIDSHKVMEIFCKDRQLNISPYYFKPGFAYGGSCLPKDSKALRTLAGDNYIDIPVINSIEQSNELQKRRAIDIILEKGRRKVGVLGLSFKAGTDDLRCSPMVDVVEALLGKGCEIRIYDKNVRISELTGTNKDFIMAKIPHLSHFISDDLDSVASGSDVLVIANKEKDFEDIPQRYPGKIIIDLVRCWREVDYAGIYEGISWGNINENPAQLDIKGLESGRDMAATDF